MKRSVERSHSRVEAKWSSSMYLYTLLDIDVVCRIKTAHLANQHVFLLNVTSNHPSISFVCALYLSEMKSSVEPQRPACFCLRHWHHMYILEGNTAQFGENLFLF